MPQIITGYFDTRRDAEMAVEHLVQDHGLDRNRVQAVAEGAENSSGTEVSGADAANAAARETPEGQRRGRIVVRAEVEESMLDTARACFEECNSVDVNLG